MTGTENTHIPADVREALFTDARTAHAWTDQPVSHELLEEVFETIKWAPTAFNASPLRIYVVESPEARARLVPFMSAGNAPKTEVAPVTLVCAADREFHEEFDTLMPGAPQVKDMVAGDPNRPVMARMNASLQIAYLIIGLRAAGLGVGPMTGFDAPGIDAEFFPDGEHQTLVVINAGYTNEDSFRPRNPRLEKDQWFRYL